MYWSDYGRAEIGLVDLRTKVKIVVLVTGPWQQSRPRGLALDTMRRCVLGRERERERERVNEMVCKRETVCV